MNATKAKMPKGGNSCLPNIFTSDEMRKIFENKYVLFIGDSVIRSMYKDFVRFLQTNDHLTDHQLKVKGEFYFENDELIEGGQKGVMSNDLTYTEVREYKGPFHLVKFYFITRCYSDYLKSICQDIKNEPEKPDLVIMNSGCWDLTRYGHNSVFEYKQNLPYGIYSLISVLPSYTVFLWTTTLPLSKDVKGGFMIPAVEHKKSKLREDVLEANYYAANLIKDLKLDLLDLHYYFHGQIQRRSKDGIHWDTTAHRRISNLIANHVCECWDIETSSRQRIKANPSLIEINCDQYELEEDVPELSIMPFLPPPQQMLQQQQQQQQNQQQQLQQSLIPFMPSQIGGNNSNQAFYNDYNQLEDNSDFQMFDNQQINFAGSLMSQQSNAFSLQSFGSRSGSGRGKMNQQKQQHPHHHHHHHQQQQQQQQHQQLNQQMLNQQQLQYQAAAAVAVSSHQMNALQSALAAAAAAQGMPDGGQQAIKQLIYNATQIQNKLFVPRVNKQLTTITATANNTITNNNNNNYNNNRMVSGATPLMQSVFSNDTLFQQPPHLAYAPITASTSGGFSSPPLLPMITTVSPPLQVPNNANAMPLMNLNFTRQGVKRKFTDDLQ